MSVFAMGVGPGYLLVLMIGAISMFGPLIAGGYLMIRLNQRQREQKPTTQ